MSNRQPFGVSYSDNKLWAAKHNVLSVCSITNRCPGKEPALLPRTQSLLDLAEERRPDLRKASLNKVIIIIKAVEIEREAFMVLMNYVTFHPRYLGFSKRTNTMSAPSHSTACEARDQTVSESMWPGQFGSWTRDTQRKLSPSSSWKAREVVCPQGLAERVSPNSSPMWMIVHPL